MLDARCSRKALTPLAQAIVVDEDAGACSSVLERRRAGWRPTGMTKKPGCLRQFGLMADCRLSEASRRARAERRQCARDALVDSFDWQLQGSLRLYAAPVR